MRVLAVSVTERDHPVLAVSPGVRRRARPIGRLPRGALLVGLLGLGAGTPVDGHAAPAPSPAELLVSIAIGPAATLRPLAAYAESVKPGLGANLSDQVVRGGLAAAVGASSLDGFDPASWTYLLIASVDAAPAMALLGKVADARKLAGSAGATHVMSRGGWAIVGPTPLLERIGAYALATLATQRVPGAPTATVYLSNVVARYKTQIDEVHRQMLASATQLSTGPMARFMGSYVDGAMSLLDEIDKVVVALEVTPELASLDLAVSPRPSSRLAKFVAVQRPTDYALLDRLPQTPVSLLLGGHLEMGPYRAGMLELMAAMYGPAPSKDLLAGMEAFRKVMTGDLAMAMRFVSGSGMGFTQVIGVSDAAAADKALAAILDLFKTGQTLEAMGISHTFKANPGTTAYNGVALRSYDTSTDLSKLPEAERKAMEAVLPPLPSRVQLATFDRLAMIVLASDSLAEAGRVIDAARGKAPRFRAPAIVGQLFASSRARKDSIAMMMDLGAILATMRGQAPAGVEPVVVSLGCADHKAHIRLAVPATTARSAVNQGQP